MEEYNYLEEVIDAVEYTINDYDSRYDYESRDDYRMRLYNGMINDDYVTGSEAYYVQDTSEVKKHVLGGIETVAKAYREYSMDLGADIENKDWGKIDATAKGYCLGEALDTVLDEMGVK